MASTLHVLHMSASLSSVFVCVCVYIYIPISSFYYLFIALLENIVSNKLCLKNGSLCGIWM